MNPRQLRALILQSGDTQSTLADALGISLSNLNAKINGKGTCFRQSEIAAIKARYHLSAGDVDSIFFAN